MATLSITAGALSYSKDASNAKADRVITACALHFGYQGDSENKAAVLAFFGDALVKRIESIAAAEEERSAASSAVASAATNRPAWSA